MIRLQKVLVFTALLLSSPVSLAQRSSELSSDFPDSGTLAVQTKVEELFDAGEYERSFFIYRNELAPIGDKYAQYMVGFMYQSGLGVDEDNVAAAAWYQLAAERGTREFVVVRDRMLHVLDDESAASSRRLYRELRLKYCDLAVLLSSIKRNLKELQTRTGSRVRGQSRPVTVIGSRSSRNRSTVGYYADVRNELETRLQHLKETGGFASLETDVDRVNIHELERLVEERIVDESD